MPRASCDALSALAGRTNLQSNRSSATLRAETEVRPASFDLLGSPMQLPIAAEQ
jgi:hypothetical protein